MLWMPWRDCQNILFWGIKLNDWHVLLHWNWWWRHELDENCMAYLKDVVLWVIWYHMYKLKYVKNTHGGVILLVKFSFSLQLYWKYHSSMDVFTFLKLQNGTKSRKASHNLAVIQRLVFSQWFSKTSRL